MELNLSRVDYLHLGSSFSNCLKFLPNLGEGEVGNPQKIVVANRDGILQVVGWKKHEPIYTCKVSIQAPICAIQLGGAVGTPKDKIFIASGNVVRGYTKKGKMFLEFDTNLAENISFMDVMGGHLLVSGINVYSQFEDLQDAGYYVTDDEISCILALPIEKVKELVPVLACKDRTLQILSKAKLVYTVHLEGIPSCLALVNGDGGENGTDVMYATLDGKLGLVTLNKTEGILRWTISSNNLAGITCMDFYDLTTDESKELIVGFDDGNVQVYALDSEEYHAVLPRLIFSQSCHESITSTQGGIFGSKGFEEILVVTYSGWVFGLTTEITDKKVKIAEGTLSISDDTRQKLSKLKFLQNISPSFIYVELWRKTEFSFRRSEIDELQEKVSIERDRYQTATRSQFGGLSAIPYFTINDKMILNKEDASYLLTIEVESPIDTILVQSDVPLDLLDVEKNSAVVSFSHVEPNSGNFLLTTFRCQANTMRIEVRIRTIEGQHGTIKAYTTPRTLPKSCQVSTFIVKPLSLHVRTHSFDPYRPYNILTLKGQFSSAEMHNWINYCLPEMPERAPLGENVNVTFVSAFLDTLLQCTYGKAEATFKSDNVSTISILKDCLTKQATNKKIQLEIDFEFNEESVLHTLQLIRPKLEGFLTLSKQVLLIDSLKEIEAHEPDVQQVLSSEYKYILQNAEELRSNYKRQPSYLERLYGMITDLYIDKHKYNGVNVKSRVPQLVEVLEKQNFDELVDFFQAPLN